MPCPGPFHFSHSVHYIYDFCPLPDPDVGPFVFLCDVEHIFSFWSVRPKVCSVLIWSVSRSLHHNYVIAGSTQELYTCLFRQMARLLLKISRCLAYAAQPAMILRRLLSSDSSCNIGCTVVLVVFMCIGICHQQSGDWRENLHALVLSV